LLVALAIEHFGMMPDALRDMVDRTAAEYGRDPDFVLVELLAHFELKDQDNKAALARARQQAYMNRR
jgi:alkanesulfonate monooxygenase SsuD/methylene tetrahydromethanopterin reductase-like flavin-dependent oxidoreductase (luciferase family)